jgi:hypothetical protein
MADSVREREILSRALPIARGLAQHFHVPVCEVRINQRIRYLRGRYRRHPVRTMPIIILSASEFTVDILLHEFAHHLQYCSSPNGINPFDQNGTCWEHHGREFFEELIRVTTAYYGEPSLYNWEETEIGQEQVLAWWELARRNGIKLEAKVYARGDDQPYLFEETHDEPIADKIAKRTSAGK